MSSIAGRGRFEGGPCSRRKLYSTCDTSTVCRPHGVAKQFTRAYGMQALEKLVTAPQKTLAWGWARRAIYGAARDRETMALSQRKQQCNYLKPPVSYGVIDCQWKVFTPVLSCSKTCGVDKCLLFHVIKSELNNVAVLPASESATPR